MNLIELLEYTFLAGGFTTRSDKARENAELVAEAAQCGYITTLTPQDGFGTVWRLTPAGFDMVFTELHQCDCPDCRAMRDLPEVDAVDWSLN